MLTGCEVGLGGLIRCNSTTFVVMDDTSRLLQSSRIPEQGFLGSLKSRCHSRPLLLESRPHSSQLFISFRHSPFLQREGEEAFKKQASLGRAGVWILTRHTCCPGKTQ